MVTRIPPMIAAVPEKFDPSCAVQDISWDESNEAQQVTWMKPILFFSYEGDVAVEGIVTNIPGSGGQDCVDDGHKATGNIYGMMAVCIHMVQCTLLFLFIAVKKKASGS